MNALSVLRFATLDSTQTHAKRLTQEGAPPATVICAGSQTAGYGRKGDAWESATGGLWFSVILRPAFAPVDGALFSVQVAQRVADVLGRHFPGIDLTVKAPNDVLAGSSGHSPRKICGILVEASVTGDNYDWMVVGVGINVNNSLSVALKSRAVTLKELAAREVALEPLLADLVDSITSLLF
ncbi:MAG: biotin--[acetyl-CoA-carboxylase] ligase [Elusimicrobiota bacterium]